LASIIIAVGNAVMQKMIIEYVTWLGFETKTSEISWIKWLVFFVTTFNTSFLIFIAAGHSDVSEIFYVFGRSQGRYADFTVTWYEKYPQIICKSMILSSVIEILTFI
jgi:hypothetical protein